uniref:sulfate adenylyltransferase n=1 Tax=Paulinella longichromatophora TaxID=1708747 RepID=A0A2H4ZPT6_9EUKA|nr:sulfate adenylyltransferase [Paulinella longichromatophora]
MTQTPVSNSHRQEIDGLIEPHGGKLVDLRIEPSASSTLKSKVNHILECSHRNACDVELLMVGGFSPLEGFMSEDNYNSVVDSHRLVSGLLFGLPIVMDTDREDIEVGHYVLLRYQGRDLAIMNVDSKWEPNKPQEALNCYGTTSIEHPAVRMITSERGQFYLGGPIYGLDLPQRVFPCKTPLEVRAELPRNEDVVAFQCRNPIHRAHYELFTRALHADNVSSKAVVLVHPTCGPTQGDDISGAIRFKTYECLAAEVNNLRIRWAYLPYSMHMAGPREALQHMIIRKNYGCTHFIIGRDMAGCKSSITGNDFYGPYDAQNFAAKIAIELKMKTVPSLNLVYTEEKGYVIADEAEKDGLHIKKLSGTEFRKMLRSGQDIPEWFAFRSVVEVLRTA